MPSCSSKMSAHFWNDAEIILYIIIAVLVVDNLWAVYLLIREIIAVHEVEQVPPVISPYLPQDLFNKMRTYKIHKSWFTVINTLLIAVFSGILELFFGFYPWLWGVATKCSLAKWMEHEACVSVFYVLLLSLYMTLKACPGMLYEKLCIRALQERKHPPWLRRICREIIDAILAVIFMGLTVVSLVFMVLWLEEYTAVGLYVQSLLLTLLLILLVPFLIDPFVGKRVPLENANLRSDLEHLTDIVDFPMRQVHIIRVNDPNTPSNAFFYGSCCLKRIVIFDTLLLNRGRKDLSTLSPEDVGKGLRDSQVVAVVAHELGHWVHGHFYKAIFMFQFHMILMLSLFHVLFTHGPIYQAVGFEAGLQPVVVGFLIVFGFVLTPYLTLSNFCMLSATRHFEYQADSFAWEMGFSKDLRQALLKLYADNLAFPISDPCYSSWNHTHPTMLDRLNRLEKLQQRHSNGT
ncbi:CAAX prenyl protease 1 homolog [Drosophila subobscura]|uniref:CAAX prenyl protease 1 homolog n=1 Tax=Drosophila subobscura TaxID=7241 RepID=UPI00155AA66D|nr:CAAX prenyl protease 1 homolog [Drosophila subobscura]